MSPTTRPTEQSTPEAKRLRSLLGPLGIFLAAGVAATAAFVAFAWQAGDHMAREIEAGHMRLAQLAASQADRVVVEAFYEIEQMALAADLGAAGRDLSGGDAGLEEIHDRVASFHAGVAVLDGEGRVLFAEPLASVDHPDSTGILAAAVEAEDRTTSTPWIDPATRHAMTALSVPVYGPRGARAGTIVGIVDLAEPLISDLILPAARLGSTGHADLVDGRGIVLASTNPEHVLSRGDHPDFYSRAASERAARVARVVHLPEPGDRDTSTRHLMAYAPLKNVPWGVAMGADVAEAMEPVRRYEYRLLVFAAASAAVLLVAAVIAARGITRRPGNGAREGSRRDG